MDEKGKSTATESVIQEIELRETPLKSFSESKEKNKTPHRFQPGESGNPGGRPKALPDLIRKQAMELIPGDRLGRTYLQRLVQDSYRTAQGSGVAAGKMQAYLLDRLFGKTATPIEVSGLENLAERLKQARARVAADEFSETTLTPVEMEPERTE